LQTGYRQFCKRQPVEHSVADLGEVIDYYNKAASALPDHNKLKGLKLPGESIVLDIKGERLAEMFEENQRRVWIPLADNCLLRRSRGGRAARSCHVPQLACVYALREGTRL
jgi:penicillin-binding protein 1A